MQILQHLSPVIVWLKANNHFNLKQAYKVGQKSSMNKQINIEKKRLPSIKPGNTDPFSLGTVGLKVITSILTK